MFGVAQAEFLFNIKIYNFHTQAFCQDGNLRTYMSITYDPKGFTSYFHRVIE